MYDEFTRKRITELRLKKDISESQLSKDLGHSRNYIQNIIAKPSLPSMTEFFYICDYFNITPKDFFDTKLENPILLSSIINDLKDLSEKDLLAIKAITERLKK